MIRLPDGLTVEDFLRRCAALDQLRELTEQQGDRWPTLEEQCRLRTSEYADGA